MSPGRISGTVLVSHIHPDHVDGLYDDSGARIYPNAEYRVGAEELAFWSQKNLDLSWSPVPPPRQDEMIAAAIRLLDFSNGSLTTFRGGEAAAPGVGTISLPGHTPGQSRLYHDEWRQAVALHRRRLHHTRDVDHHARTTPHPGLEPRAGCRHAVWPCSKGCPHQAGQDLHAPFPLARPRSCPIYRQDLHLGADGVRQAGALQLLPNHRQSLGTEVMEADSAPYEFRGMSPDKKPRAVT